MKLEVSHRFVSESVVGVVAETSFKEGLGLLHAPRVDKYVGANGVGFGGGEGSELKRGGIGGYGHVHGEHLEVALVDVAFEQPLKLVEIAEDMLRGGDGI